MVILTVLEVHVESKVDASDALVTDPPCTDLPLPQRWRVIPGKKYLSRLPVNNKISVSEGTRTLVLNFIGQSEIKVQVLE